MSLVSTVAGLVFSFVIPIGVCVTFTTLVNHGEVVRPILGRMLFRRHMIRETMDPEDLFSLGNQRHVCKTSNELRNSMVFLTIIVSRKSWYRRQDVRRLQNIYEKELTRLLVQEIFQQRANGASSNKSQKPKQETVSQWRAILDVPKNVNDGSVIKQHYRKLAMQHHPDRGGNAEQMAKINRAFDMAKKELSL